MFRKYIIPLIALCGVAMAIYVVVSGAKPTPSALPVALPPQDPFKSKVAGAGIIEANTLNRAIGTNIAGVVVDVPHHVGFNDDIKAGDVLFKIDDRNLQADLVSKKAALASAQAKLDKLLASPRPEDVPPAEARVNEAVANLDDVKVQMEMAEALQDPRAMSREELSKRRHAVAAAEARLAQANADLTELKAGTWKPDLEVARADVASAQAAVRAAEVEIDRAVVRSPVDGKLLQCTIRPGMYAQAGVLADPLMVVGNIAPMNVRVDVDENDAWRVTRSARAIAYVRGNRSLSTWLKFDHFDGYVIPKKSLTGDTTERVDTRVLQVIYSMQDNTLPVYVGQQMDVSIEAADTPRDATTLPAGPPAGQGQVAPVAGASNGNAP